MKFRNGFVSNSSSASFVVTWRCDTDEGEDGSIIPLEDAIDLLLEYCNPDLRDEIIKMTKVQDNGSFITTGWTSMVNSYSDFPPEIKDLVFALIAEQSNDAKRACFDLLDTHIEYD